MENQNRSNTKDVARIGLAATVAEIKRRGARAYQVAGNKNIILASSINGTRKVSLRVKTRSRGDWQTSYKEGRDCSEPTDETNFWILVDLSISPQSPDFYIIPDWWFRNNIYEAATEWFRNHGGIRPKNPDSDHHRISLDRIESWKDDWDKLRIF